MQQANYPPVMNGNNAMYMPSDYHASAITEDNYSNSNPHRSKAPKAQPLSFLGATVDANLEDDENGMPVSVYKMPPMPVHALD